MKINQYIIALILVFAVTGAQPAHAGAWDYISAPFNGVMYVVQTIWAHRPISKVSLMSMERELKQGITQNHEVLRQSILDNSNAIYSQFEELKKAQEQEKREAEAALREAQTLNEKTVPGLAQKLQDYEKTSSVETGLLQNRAAVIEKEGAGVLAKIIALKLQQIAYDENDKKHAQALVGIQENISGLKVEVAKIKTSMREQTLLTKRVELTAAAVLAKRGSYSQFSSLAQKHQ